MPFYHTLGRIPKKRHIAFRKPDGGLYAEQLVGHEGFTGTSALLYHIHPPTTVKSVRRVKEISLEVRYADMDEERVRKIREIFEDHAGEIPVSVTIVEVPPEIAAGALRMKINHHFRVQPGPALTAALEAARVRPQYVFEARPNHAA